MGSTAPALTDATLGAWLLKTRPDPASMADWQRSGFAGVRTRCVRETYRTQLVRAGQPVLLWVSGADPACPSGIYACGRTTGVVTVEPGTGAVMPVRLHALDAIVARSDVLGVPRLRDIEVLRMPAGSNPSYLSRRDYDLLRQTFPQLYT